MIIPSQDPTTIFEVFFPVSADRKTAWYWALERVCWCEFWVNANALRACRPELEQSNLAWHLIIAERAI